MIQHIGQQSVPPIWRFCCPLYVMPKLLLVLLILIASLPARADGIDSFKKFDQANEDAKPLVAYIQTTDWSNVLKYITSYQKLSENKFLYVVSFPLINAGIYIADTEKNIQDKIISGDVGAIERLDASIKGKEYYLINLGGGSHGVGWGRYAILKISNLTNVAVRNMFDYSYDMVNGLCGRRELGIDKAIDVKSHKFVRAPAPSKVVFSVIEQNCHSGKKRPVRRIFPIDSE